MATITNLATREQVQIQHFSCAETAKLIRAALKPVFPRVTFSVKSKVYSGGASISVSWTDGPTVAEVERVAKGFAGATFDGQIDLKSYHTSVFNGQPVRFGADFVFCNRRVSKGLVERAIARAAFIYGPERVSNVRAVDDGVDSSDVEAYSLVHRVLYRLRGDGLLVTLKDSIQVCWDV